MGNNNSTSSSSSGRPHHRDHYQPSHHNREIGTSNFQFGSGPNEGILQQECDPGIQVEQPNLSTSSLHSHEFPGEAEETGSTTGGSGGESESDEEGEERAVVAERKQLRPKYKVFKFEELQKDKLTFIGEGGFGKVLLGGFQHGKRVAIKMFHAPPTRPDTPEHFARLTRLFHRNVVPILGLAVGANDALTGEIESPKVVLQYFSEGNLLQYLAKKENPQDYAMLGKLALDIIHGCEYLHSRNVIHGDISARNILVEKSMSKHKTHYNAKVSDYGIIQHFEASGGNYVKNKSGKSVPVRWVPRELIVDDATATDFSFASDVWSFGVVLWEMWTKGDTPYGVTCTNAQVVQHLKDGKSPLSTDIDRPKPKGCPNHIMTEMKNIFTVNPEERPKFRELGEKFSTFKNYGRENSQADNQHGGQGTTQKREGVIHDVDTHSEQGEEKKSKKKGKKAHNAPLNASAVAKENKDSAADTKIHENSEKKQSAKAAKGGSNADHVSRQGELSRNQETKDSQLLSSTPKKEQPASKQGKGSGGEHLQKGGKGGDHSHKTGKGSGNQARNNAHRGRGFHHQGANRGFSHHQQQRNYTPRSPSPINHLGFGLMNPDLMAMPPVSQAPAPPPYSASPLPNHSAFSGLPSGYGPPHPPAYFTGPPPLLPHQGGLRDTISSHGTAPSGNSYDHEIQRLEEEIRVKKTQKMAKEISEKQVELSELIQKMTLHGMSMARTDQPQGANSAAEASADHKDSGRFRGGGSEKNRYYGKARGRGRNK